MKSSIVANVEEKMAQQLEGEYLSCFTLRKRMADLLRKDLDALHQSMRDEDIMSSSSWPYVQAAKIGEAKALLKLISLLGEK